MPSEALPLTVKREVALWCLKAWWKAAYCKRSTLAGNRGHLWLMSYIPALSLTYMLMYIHAPLWIPLGEFWWSAVPSPLVCESQDVVRVRLHQKSFIEWDGLSIPHAWVCMTAGHKWSQYQIPNITVFLNPNQTSRDWSATNTTWEYAADLSVSFAIRCTVPAKIGPKRIGVPYELALLYDRPMGSRYFPAQNELVNQLALCYDPTWALCSWLLP